MNSLCAVIGYEFKNNSLLTEALTHTSYANEHGLKNRDNERLEFLGDAVLSIIVSDFLFGLEPRLPEGELTRARASLVCEKTLFDFARELDLGLYMFLGKGELATGGAGRASILSDCFEALIAAIYLDGGIAPARDFVLGFVTRRYAEKGDAADYKTKLQEVVQHNPEERLHYTVVCESGPDHDKTFTVEVRLNSNVIGTGTGRNKKQAEQTAAREALKLLGL